MERIFWTTLGKLVEQSEIIIDRLKEPVHPVHPDFIYQVNYGFLRNTSFIDREGIGIWAGSDHTAGIDVILCTVDLLKRDSEIKILLDCMGEGKILIYKARNDTSCMKGILIRRTAGISYKP